jgi:hypothetical protein
MRGTMTASRTVLLALAAWAAVGISGPRALVAQDGNAGRSDSRPSARAASSASAASRAAGGPNLADLARRYEKFHRYSTLFTAQAVRRTLSTSEDLDKAIDWCKRSGIRRVFLETFRGNFMPDPNVLVRARDRFRAEGFDVSGCVTTTGIGPRGEPNRSDNYCFAADETHKNLARVFSYTAGLFDEIIIDDFLFTMCECKLCDAARNGRDWAQYHCDVMTEVSEKYILAPARSANPKVRVIIKYPNWYSGFRGPGYDVVRETKLYPAIWVGTETREANDLHWGGIQQYGGFFLMRWFAALGGEKTGGGWFDEIDTGPVAYVEQARQTILGGAAESMLFNYGSLIRGQSKLDHDALLEEMPKLFELSEAIHGKAIRGVAAPLPAADNREDGRVFDFVGMIGIPLVPMTEIPSPAQAKAVFLTAYWAGDAKLPEAIQAFRKAGTAVLMTDTLASALQGKADLAGVVILPAGEKMRDLLALDPAKLNALRAHILPAVGMGLEGPSRVAIYPLGEDLLAVENFNNEKATVLLRLDGWSAAKVQLVLGAAEEPAVGAAGNRLVLDVAPRALVLLRRADVK